MFVELGHFGLILRFASAASFFRYCELSQEPSMLSSAVQPLNQLSVEIAPLPE